MADTHQADKKQSFLSRAVNLFLRGDIAPVLVVLALVLGAVAVTLTSREEEPQIVVPMADVMIRAPGMPAEEVERQVASPLEKLLFQIDGVEHVYSASSSGQAIVTVRFHVGEDREDSLVKIYNKIYSHTDNLPPDVASWVVKPIEIDDVPIVVVTLWSEDEAQIDDFHLRRIADELEIELQSLPDTNRTTVYGGRPRVVRVEVNTAALAARRTSVLDVAWALGVSNVRQEAGSLDRMNRNMIVDAGDYFGDLAELEGAVVNVVDGIPVFLKDVAEVVDGPAERAGYSWFGFGAASENEGGSQLYPTVHVAVAKKKGTNAVTVAARIEERLEKLRASHFPAGVKVMVTRNYGETANDKVNELLEALAVAIVIVVGLIAYSLGWREGLIVAAAVPITFAITLAINYWAGYTINRVTLFALILSLGLVVDDPIVGVENIYRHLRMRKGRAVDAVHGAMIEVLPPIVIATLTVIVSFLPLYLITGMMGPYMSPMALNVPIAMLASMFVSLTITPWLSYKMLKKHADDENAHDGQVGVLQDSGMYKFYARFMAPLMNRRALARKFLWGTAALFVFAVVLGVVRAVPLKMLPFDNKNEFQIVVDMPEGVTLERTDTLTRRLAAVVSAAPEVTNYAIYSGQASPMDFNGMVRHYFLRQGPNVAEIRVNLAGKRNRAMNSHEILLRLRNDLEAVAQTEGARIALVEVPPGPPVLSTVTVEISGAPNTSYEDIRQGALIVAERLKREPGVGDVDTTVEADATRYLFVTDKEKAALSGIAASDVADTVSLALSGKDVSRLHAPGEVKPLAIRLRMARADRTGLEALQAMHVKGRQGIVHISDEGGLRAAPIPFVPLGELGRFEERGIEKAIYHKDLRPVAYVYAEAVGRVPAAIAVDVSADQMGDAAGVAQTESRPLAGRTYATSGGGVAWNVPEGVTVNWLGEGELNITVDVFRDLGIAFGVALIGIYMLLVYQTASYSMPLILMISIPLTLIGIMPGFWVLNLIGAADVAGYGNPIFFTATAMIGMIALAGIAVRNAILLIEFLHVGLVHGRGLKDAILEAGAVRVRAILLTAGTAMLAAIPITLDPVFSGLAWAMIFGLFVSTAFTLFVVPLTYFIVYEHKPGHGVPVRSVTED